MEEKTLLTALRPFVVSSVLFLVTLALTGCDPQGASTTSMPADVKQDTSSIHSETSLANLRGNW
ncbi:MAG: hypothetical protein OHK0029_21840 [Armatimonadaceae bacterium]